MTEEENPRELDKRLRNQIQNLLESKEGRNLWAGEIQFQSIQLNNSSVSISYVDADGVKTFTCEEPPREEFRIAMQAMSFYYFDMAGTSQETQSSDPPRQGEPLPHLPSPPVASMFRRMASKRNRPHGSMSLPGEPSRKEWPTSVRKEPSSTSMAA